MIVNKVSGLLLFRTVCDLRQSRQQHSTCHIAQLSSISPARREAGDRSDTRGAPVWCRSSSRLPCRQRRRADYIEVR